MKKENVLFYFMFFLLVLSSCNVTELGIEKQADENYAGVSISDKKLEKEVNKIILNYNKEARKLRLATIKSNLEDTRDAIAILTPEQKEMVWMDKMVYTLQYSEWNVEQYRLLVSIANQINTDLFISGTKSNISFTEKFAPDWALKAKATFSDDEIIATVMDIDNFVYDNVNKVLVNSVVCNCYQSQDLCSSVRVCRPSTVEWPCSPKTSGCGLFTLFPCDGRCLFEGPNGTYYP